MGKKLLRTTLLLGSCFLAYASFLSAQGNDSASNQSASEQERCNRLCEECCNQAPYTRGHMWSEFKTMEEICIECQMCPNHPDCTIEY